MEQNCLKVHEIRYYLGHNVLVLYVLGQGKKSSQKFSASGSKIKNLPLVWIIWISPQVWPCFCVLSAHTPTGRP